MKDHDDKKDLVRERVRRQAQQSAKDLVAGLTRKARQDVNERLKQLDRDRFIGEDMAWSPPCGTRLDSADGLEKGVVTLFSRWSTQARMASAQGDRARALALAIRLSSLPLDTLPQLRHRLGKLLEELA
ncbi:MAG: hypothetical protein ABIK09_10915 [Pseudomonadota bacterium]